MTTRSLAYPIVAASLVAVVGVAVLNTRGGEPPCPANAPGVLLEWFDAKSALHPRWSGCFAGKMAGAATSSLVTPVQTRGALAAFELATERRTQAAIENFGVALTLAGDASRGLTTLQSVSAERPEADSLSNLAAVYLARGGQNRAPYDFVLALEHARHALSIDGRHPAALYNEALALSALQLHPEADHVWRRYLELDARSPWADRAREALVDPARHLPSGGAQLLDLLHRKIADADALASRCAAGPQTCREQVQEVVIPGWGAAVLSGDSAAATAALDVATALTRGLRDLADQLDADTVADIRDALARGEPRVRQIAAGAVAYGRAREAFENAGDFAQSFEEAEALLTAARSPLAGWARANRVYAAFNTYDAAGLRRLGPELEAWAGDAAARHYGALEGRLLYLAGISFGNRAEFAAAEPLWARSIEALERARQLDHLAATHVAVADWRLRTGDPQQGWQFFARAFENLRDTQSARRRYVIYLNSGTWLGDMQLTHAAIRILSLARDVAAQTNQPGRVAEASLYLAKAFGRLGATSAAKSALDTARPDPGLRTWGRSDRARHEYLAGVAEVEQRSDPPAAIGAADDAIAFFEGRGSLSRVAGLHLIRGRAHKAAGDLARAADDFDTGIATYERYRSSLSSAQQRLTSQDVVWDLYEEQLAMARHSPAQALDVAERGRARTLLESLRHGPIAPVSPASLAGMLSSAECMLYFAATEQELLVWAIGNRGVTFAASPVPRATLDRLVTAFVGSITNHMPESGWHPQSEQLFDLVIEPIRDQLPESGSVMIVPDGPLHRLPFSALRSARTRRFLIEDYELTTAPSATFVAQAFAARGKAGAAGAPHVLVAGDPTVGRDSEALAGADFEARSIAALYSSADLLTRGLATKPAFLSRIADADVVHFAGHSVSSPDYPLLAHLEFSDPSGTAGGADLRADEIAALQLTRPRVVVLAACRTAVGAVRRGEGILSLARPFLVAGVPSVVATLWDIDDRESAPLFQRLHETLARGVPPSQALHHAIRDVPGTLPPAVWAGFTLVGIPGSNPPAK